MAQQSTSIAEKGTHWLVFRDDFDVQTTITSPTAPPTDRRRRRRVCISSAIWAAVSWFTGLSRTPEAKAGNYISGNEHDNILYGDKLPVGVGGDDVLEGGEGDDTIYGGAGRDRIDGMEDDDRLYGNSGNDTINGGAGVDRIEGGFRRRYDGGRI